MNTEALRRGVPSVLHFAGNVGVRGSVAECVTLSSAELSALSTLTNVHTVALHLLASNRSQRTMSSCHRATSNSTFFQPSPFKGYPVREIEVEIFLLSILSIALVYYFEFINF